MSSMEFNKLSGAILLGGLIAMMTGFIAEVLVEPEHLEQNAYVVDTSAIASAAPAAAEGPAEPPPIAPLLASADPAAGERVSKACASCHSFEKGGAAKVGPNLWGVVDGPHGHMEGFAYSSAIKEMPGNWDYEALNHFLLNPKGYAPGTKMNFAGVKKDQDRANLIAWLRAQADNPAPLPQ
ncbi:cytochrome C [Skermanella stibiiresistens SB22]|uniref:Cytochrome C n=1 Tax=Skermanella stibiiresistens SB22 TaxID=1385369 RepID=W9H620_9PROT|nr:cytochrome c family protein [Skermanella stibiiresistens]EWY39203.1 cytochrome C [Skermanella stibiiresistens SB22]